MERGRKKKGRVFGERTTKLYSVYITLPPTVIFVSSRKTLGSRPLTTTPRF